MIHNQSSWASIGAQASRSTNSPQLTKQKLTKQKLTNRSLQAAHDNSQEEFLSQIQCRSTLFRAPRITSNLQGRCGHEKAAEEAAEQENLISTIVEII
jgi:hypothetical protein